MEAVDLVQTEHNRVRQSAQDIEAWWASPRQRHLKRPYSATKIAILRSPLEGNYAASTQALKLWNQLNKHRANETSEMTFGMIDPIMASQMVGQQTIYISGALCAFSEADCSGQDTSDYPWDTVPKVAERMFRSQKYHDRRQRQYLMQLSDSDRQHAFPIRDYLQPIVADADMGFGTTTTIVKLVQRLVEAGVAMFHIDDLAIGAKSFTKGEGPTVVPTSEWLQRLCTARMQLDVMGAETLLMTRCDVDGAQYITSTIDPRDHAYILGATQQVESLASVIRNIPPLAYQERRQATAKWSQNAAVMTFDDAVKSVTTNSQYRQYRDCLSSAGSSSLEARQSCAKQILGRDPPFFSWDLARTIDGRYQFKPTLDTIIERCLVSAALGDVTWARMDVGNRATFSHVHQMIRTVYPNRLFAAGYSATSDFASKGLSTSDVENLHRDLAKLGVVWQLQPGFAMQGLNYFTKQFSQIWAREGIAGYIRDIQGPAMDADADTYEKMSWSGGYLADAYTDLSSTC